MTLKLALKMMMIMMTDLEGIFFLFPSVVFPCYNCSFIRFAAKMTTTMIIMMVILIIKVLFCC